jgi:hypothetical protein
MVDRRDRPDNQDKETTMSTDLKQETTFARRMALAIMCAFAVGVLAIALSTDRTSGIVPAATAAAPSDDGYRAGYFPAQFPAPDSPVEPHIEAF